MRDRLSKIAVVGIGAQLPSGDFSNTNLDHKAFFEFLLQKGEAYEPIPKERFNTDYIRGKATGNIITDKGAFLKDLDQFDFLEFGITSKDARLMPLSTRKLVEVAFLALHDSGIDYRGKNVGCYMSGVAHDIFAVSGHDDAEVKGSFAYGPSMVANRVSYHLDLRGPSLPLDTACSSSLYATHLAVQALRSGDCDAAVVGGCQLNHRFTDWLTFTQGGILSPEGKCKPFDASANGFGRGEGAVAIVLKSLEDALRDNDHIYATILGTGLSQCGSLAPVSAPVASAQREAMLRAFEQTDRRPGEVDFLELHATGTAQGDPTEANWVGKEFKRDDELIIGSVKGNVGHLEITAFLASLCKVCGIFETGHIPPNVNFSRPNPAIRWSEYRFRVPTEVESLKHHSSGRPPLVAMTSSGIGGANGHCVIEGPPPNSPAPSTFWIGDVDVPLLLVAGGLSPRSTSAVAESLLAVPHAGLAYLARIYGRRVRSMTWRSFSVTKAGEDAKKFSEPLLTPKMRGPIVFVFSGQGTQHFHMGRDLFRSCAPFRDSVLELDKVYAAAVGTSLIETTGLFTEGPLNAVDPLGDPWPIALTLPALTMLQLALVDALAAAGVVPDVVVGHSAGETAVLSASRSASKAMAFEIAIARGRAMSLIEEAQGTMAAVSCSPEDALEIIAEVNAELGEGTLAVGCYNTRAAVTLSGSESHIDLAVKKARARGVFARKLRTRIPVHSAMMELCREEFQKLVKDVFARYPTSAPKVETYSTTTGGLFEELFDAQYFWEGTINPVRFTEAIGKIAEKHKHATYVEIGPHPVLTSYISSMTEKNTLVTCPLRRQRTPVPGSDVAELLTTLGKLVVAGHNCVDFDSLYGGETTLASGAPPYPFAPKTVPWRIPTAEIVRQLQHRNGPLNYPQLQVNIHTHPGLADHVIKEEPIMPAAGFIEMALEFGAREVYNVEFHGMLPLSSERPVPIQVTLEGSRWSVNSAPSTDYNKVWPIQYNRRHATGFLSMEPTSDVNVTKLDLAAIRNRMHEVSMDGFYERLATFAQYGPMYRRIQKCHLARGPQGTVEVLTEVRGSDKDIPNLSDYRLHPAILDAAIHVMVHPVLTGNYDADLYHLPSKVSAVRLLHEGPFPSIVFGYGVLVSWSPDTIVWNATITDEHGVPLCILEGIEVALHGHRIKAIEKRYEVVYRPTGLSISKDNDITLAQTSRIGSQPQEFTASSLSSQSSLSSEGTDLASRSTAPSSNADAAQGLIFDYVRGDEMKIQATIVSLNVFQPLSLLFIAQDGADGAAALGFTRSLRKEYRAWIIRVVVFDATWTPSQIAQAAQELLVLNTEEEEFKVAADGSILVPRIDLVDPPSSSIPLSLTRPWKVENGEVVQALLPTPPKNHVVVHISGISRAGAGPWVFVGKASGYVNHVVGICTGPISSHLEVHKGSIVEVQAGFFTESEALLEGPSILAPMIVALAVGPAAFASPERIEGTRVLIVDDSEFGPRLHQICVQLRLDATLVPSMNGALLKPYYLQQPNLILSGTRDVRDGVQLRSILASRGQLLLWNNAEEGLASIAANAPWSVGDALRDALKYHDAHRAASVAYIPPTQLLPSATTNASLAADLFGSEKTYLLAGGIGSLGLHVALWMYKNGARHLVLTSRSGPATLDRAGDWVAQRILHYLRNRDDLSIKTVAVDASSEEHMTPLIRNLSPPLGGCLLIAGLLNDRTFASQTVESFESVFPPKAGALRVLERAVDVDALDFVVAFSSISGLFGNAGQTSYATANTMLAGMIRRHRNAFTIVAPAISDSSLVTTTDVSYQSRLRHMSEWMMSARELCDYIADGLRKLRSGPVGEYIPNFDWRAVREGLGPSPMYDHIVPEDGHNVHEEGGDGKQSLLQIVCRVLDIKAEDVSVDVPLTTYGLDSLSAATLSFALRPLLAISQLQLLADLTIKDLQAKIEEAETSAQTGELSADTAPSDSGVSEKVKEMEAMLARLTAELPSCPPFTTMRRHSLGAIVITGTTGSVGAHVLAHLLQGSRHTQVYALLREKEDQVSAMERQVAAFEARGLDVSLLSSSRLQVTTCALDKPSLGLPKDLYEKIRTSVSHLIHLEWPINLESPLSTFESALQGLRRIIDLTRDAREFGPVTLLYGSTFAVFRNWSETSHPRETPVAPEVAVRSGYSESKWIAERLLQIASERNVVRSVVVRIGQLCGGVNGAWRATEWLPAMICASAALGSLPSGQGVVSWLPVDTAATMLIDMLDGEEALYAILHLRHPRPISWVDMMGYFSNTLQLPTVPYAQWIAKLDQSVQAQDAKIVEYVSPAIRLLPIFQAAELALSQSQSRLAESNGMGILMDIEDSSRRCVALRDQSLPQLGMDDVRKWVKYWRSIGALSAA